MGDDVVLGFVEETGTDGGDGRSLTNYTLNPDPQGPKHEIAAGYQSPAPTHPTNLADTNSTQPCRPSEPQGSSLPGDLP